ncbi:50S ribosomal protein L24 [Frankliniella fusca]|uniref:50S ribosomal protein L24 n=1 Tax=Frankliniella fusca TaxID=407009 RepID=A0AAE1LPX8_9NEOP|nr:50S ribosomal protein L24 [Frankliniella fusca]
MELQLEDPEKFRRCLRMSTAMFEYILQKVSPLIGKQNTQMRQSIPASERLSLTLRHLATEIGLRSLVAQRSDYVHSSRGDRTTFIGPIDQAFPCATGNRKDRRIFNYRLDFILVWSEPRAQRCSENDFGVMAATFQIFRAALCYDPDDATATVQAVVCLHNYLRTHSVGRAMYTPKDMLDVEDEAAGTIQQGNYHEVPANGLVRFVNQGGNRHRDEMLL